MWSYVASTVDHVASISSGLADLTEIFEIIRRLRTADGIPFTFDVMLATGMIADGGALEMFVYFSSHALFCFGRADASGLCESLQRFCLSGLNIVPLRLLQSVDCCRRSSGCCLQFAVEL